MIQDKHIGVYGLIINDGKILLIKKVSGPYDGLLDLPGGGFKFLETPIETLKREMLEETGLEVLDYVLFDTDSVINHWIYDDKQYEGHHIGIFYKILKYQNNIKQNIEVNEINDDSLGANFYEIKNLHKKDLSKIAILELEKLGYNLKD